MEMDLLTTSFPTQHVTSDCHHTHFCKWGLLLSPWESETGARMGQTAQTECEEMGNCNREEEMKGQERLQSKV